MQDDTQKSNSPFSMDNMPSIGAIAEVRTFHQLGVFVLDGSGSMGEQSNQGMTKAAAVNLATRETFTRFKASRKKDNFSFGVVTFDGSSKIHTRSTPASEIDDYASYDPLVDHGGGTNIASGIDKAMVLIEEHLAAEESGGIPHTAILLVMSDGMDQNSSETLRKVEAIKTGNNSGRVTFATILFAKVGESPEGGASSHLKTICSDTQRFYKTAYDPETIRNFFINSISAASGTAL